MSVRSASLNSMYHYFTVWGQLQYNSPRAISYWWRVNSDVSWILSQLRCHFAYHWLTLCGNTEKLSPLRSILSTHLSANAVLKNWTFITHYSCSGSHSCRFSWIILFMSRNPSCASSLVLTASRALPISPWRHAPSQLGECVRDNFILRVKKFRPPKVSPRVRKAVGAKFRHLLIWNLISEVPSLSHYGVPYDTGVCFCSLH